MICQERTRMTLSPFKKDAPDIVCTREVDDQGRHIGEHEGFEQVPANPGDPDAKFPSLREPRPAYQRIVHWSRGGASSTAYDLENPAQNCMCTTNDRMGHKPEDHHWTTCGDCGVITNSTKPDREWRQAPSAPRCSMCAIWASRLRETYLRPHPGGAMNDRWVYSFSASNPGGFGGRIFTVVMDDGTIVSDGRPGLWGGGEIPWWLDDQFPPNCTITAGGHKAIPGYTDRLGRPLDYTGHQPVKETS